MSHVNHWCAVECCFSQLGMREDERCSAVDIVKTTDVDLPRRESRTMRKRIKGFPSVKVLWFGCFFFFWQLCWHHSWYCAGTTSALLFMVSCTFSYQAYSTEL